MKRLNSAVCLAALLMLAGCATARQEPVANRLNDTNWVLIGFQNSGQDSELQEVHLYDYTMHLDSSGAVQFKFDCNQGSSTWQATPMEGGRGTLTFGTVAATTALCAAESIGETLASDINRVARYSIYDGRLTMLPDGGGRIYVWDSVD